MSALAAMLADARPAKLPAAHFTGFILSRIRRAMSGIAIDHADAVTIDQTQGNGTFGVQQARVRLNGDDAHVYRLILAPADAPIFIGTCPVDQHFAEALGGVA